jgi:signal transduction histidine kinase
MSVIFDGPGEMRALCRRFDWTATPLGRVEDWSPTLRTAAQMVLGSGLPNVVLWGPALIQLYNDAYAELIRGKHPRALGQPTRESWPEVWHINAPIYERVFAGETVTLHDALYPLERSGSPEQVYLTISYSPIREASGTVAGILTSMLESTEQVRVRQLYAERTRLYGELEAERARLEYVFHDSPAFLAVLRGPDHVLELVNDTFAILFEGKELIDRPVFEANPELRADFQPLLDHVLATGERQVRHEVPVRILTGPDSYPVEHFLDFTYMPYLEADGTRSGVIAHGTDVTAHVLGRRELERVAQLERAARAAAEEESRSRDEVLAMVSHDLRNPLAVIAMAASALLNDFLGPSTPKSAARVLSVIQRSAESLGRQIDDLLDVASIESGHLALDTRPESAAEIVARAAELSEAAVREFSLQLDMDVAPGLPLVRADAERVIQALGNLVGNAVKFTPPGGRITMHAAPEQHGVLFTVQDSGVGIAPTDLPHVFDRFWQKRRDSARRGTGLGLAIVRGIVEGHGGRLSVESAPGQGSRFSFTLPVVG